MKILTNCCKKFLTKKEITICAKCNKLLCDKHAYSYVDGNNESITKHSKSYCEDCFKQVYDYLL